MRTKEELLGLKNKHFIFACLELLEQECQRDYLSVLTDSTECKRRFDMNYAILQQVNPIGSIASEYFLDSTGHRRYYPNEFCANGRRFIVCNDWYYNTQTNKRDTRTDFTNWVIRITQ